MIEGVLPYDPSAVEKISARIAAHYRCIPLGIDEHGALRLGMTAMPDIDTLDEMRVVLRHDLHIELVEAADIDAEMKACYGIGGDTLERLATDGKSSSQAAERIETHVDAVQEASISKFVNQMLLEAHQSRATDIHLQPNADDLNVRYRIDGVLYKAKIAESLKPFQSAIVSRIKIMADLSISEKRLPQDGRIVIRVAGQEMDLRVSTLPTPFGESIGIRFLTSRRFLDLRHLGFDAADLQELESYLVKPHGIVLLTGPTGSGKTTTLYAFLKQINTDAQNIITIEDPIEYQMTGITQVQVQPKIGLTFAHGLRAMLRHDPDVMMVGEVRDLETAEIAIRVALTGHLVFSTLHTNDASGAVTRLQDIGVEPYLISSSVLCAIAQRLVRVICPDCKRPTKLKPELLAEFDLPADSRTVEIFQGRGCDRCKQTGYLGRTVIYEILPIRPAIQDLIVQRSPANVIRARAREGGMRTLRQCGWQKVLSGMTTPHEVLRVTHQEALRR